MTERHPEWTGERIVAFLCPFGFLALLLIVVLVKP